MSVNKKFSFSDLEIAVYEYNLSEGRCKICDFDKYFKSISQCPKRVVARRTTGSTSSASSSTSTSSSSLSSEDAIESTTVVAVAETKAPQNASAVNRGQDMFTEDTILEDLERSDSTLEDDESSLPELESSKLSSRSSPYADLG